MKLIGVIFRHLGPYHWARLNAAGELFPTLALEISAHDEHHTLSPAPAPGSFGKVTLFPASDTSSPRAGELERKLHRALDQHQPSAVAIPGWWEKGSLAALAWCLNNTVPAILMSDSQASDAHRTGPREAVKRRVVALCSSGFVAGTLQANYLAALGMPRERISTGYDVVDNDHFQDGARAARDHAAAARIRLGLPDKYFLACGRFVPKKNLRRLLDAYQRYRQLAGPSAWKLVLVGDGPLMPAVKNRITRLGLSSDVTVCGFQSYEKLPSYYGLASAFVHASTTEQWGLVVNEAMASGLPVIVSRQCGCASDLVAHGHNGFVFDAFDTLSLAKQLQAVAGDDCDREALSHAGREIISHWSLPTFAAGLQRAVELAFSGGRRRRELTTIDETRPAPNLVDRLLLRSLLLRPS